MEITADSLKKFYTGLQKITRKQFRNALKRSIGATADYADGCWNTFQDNPLGYLATRNPQSQSEALLRIALKNICLK